MNKPEEYNDEIESFELNEDDYINNYNQNGQNSTLLMDRFGNESSEMDQTFFKNRKPSTGWLVDFQDKADQESHKSVDKDEENNFITELDVNADYQRRISGRDDEISSLSLSNRSSRSKKSTVKNKSNILNDLPTLLDQDENLNQTFLPYPVSKNVLSLEQLNNITKKESSSTFMLENVNLSLLSKYLIKDHKTSSNQFESDIAWTYESLITEMNEYFESL